MWHNLHMQKYVVGFVFDPSREHVLLIQKLRPIWQAGLYNGVGGKIDGQESSWQAMRRECGEECGLWLDHWTFGAHLAGKDWQVDFWSSEADIWQAQSLTDEPVSVHPVSSLWTLPTLRNLPMMVSVCRDQSGVHKPVWFFE
jgi:8-oxo-dGTP pyrophosphatase MutT (NUDIX family)